MKPSEPKRWPPVGIACDELALLTNVTEETRAFQRRFREAYPQGYQEKAPPYRQYLSPEFIEWLGEIPSTRPPPPAKKRKA